MTIEVTAHRTQQRFLGDVGREGPRSIMDGAGEDTPGTGDRHHAQVDEQPIRQVDRANQPHRVIEARARETFRETRERPAQVGHVGEGTGVGDSIGGQRLAHAHPEARRLPRLAFGRVGCARVEQRVVTDALPFRQRVGISRVRCELRHLQVDARLVDVERHQRTEDHFVVLPDVHVTGGERTAVAVPVDRDGRRVVSRA